MTITTKHSLIPDQPTSNLPTKYRLVLEAEGSQYEIEALAKRLAECLSQGGER